MDVKEKILDAIQLLASNTIKKAGYDKTIQAQIVSCEDATIGKYRCRYQDSTFYAYSNNSDLSFSNGSYVYVLVPQNDFQKEKTILGTTQKLGINYISQAEGDQAYEEVGTSCINSTDTYYLDSNNINYKYVLYQYNGAEVEPTIDSGLSLDITSLDQYIKESSSLIAGATFKTNIPATRQFRGHYGILFNLAFKDNASGQQVIRSYEINEDNMIDNPYRLAYPTRQYQIFEIDGSNFIRVDSIAIFNSDFPDASGNVTNTKLNSGDIEITKLELTGALRLSESEINGVAISFYTPYGTFFTKDSVGTDKKTITAQVKVKGKLASSVQKIPFYWGRENVKITPKSNLYNKQLGRGWQCLNDRNIVIDENNLQGLDPVVEWIPGKDTVQVYCSDATAADNRYKVAIVYEDTVITKQINIKNLAATVPNITIISDAGKVFYYDLGSPTLTCYVSRGEGDQKEDITNDCVFYWGYQSNTGIFYELQETTADNNTYNNAYKNLYGTLSEDNIDGIYTQIREGRAFPNAQENNINHWESILNSYKYTQRVQGNKVHNVQIDDITNFGTFKCSVFNANNLSQYYGTASIILTNTYEGEGLYSLVINNGTVTFQYNENGIAPDNGSLDVPQQIEALSFTVYDNLGQPIDSNVIVNSKDCSVEWGFPIKDTLLEQKDQNGSPNRTTGQYNYYKNNLMLSYGINKRYDIKKKVNQITLNVNYKGMNLTAETQFTFAKQGEPGTNGTQYIVKLVPNIREGETPPLFPMVTTTAQGDHFLNYDIEINNIYTNQIAVDHGYQLFRAQLWHNGTCVWQGCEIPINTPIDQDEDVVDKTTRPSAIHWEVLKNKYTSSVSDVSDFEIPSTGSNSAPTRGFIYYKGTHLAQNYNNPYANIIKCSITWQGKLYYGTIPIVTTWVSNNKYNISLKDYTGFRYVMYTSDGMTPQYDNSHPFEFICEETINGIKEDVSLVEGSHAVDYQFSSCGNIYTAFTSGSSQQIGLVDQPLLQALTQDYYRKGLTKNQIRYRPISRYDGQCVNAAILCQYTQNGSVIGKINVPIHFLLNKYGLAHINEWDGNSVQINSQGGYILAPQMGAGFKDANNNFTGVLMGQVKVADKKKSDTGLLGYSQGIRTFFVNSDNGSAIFGKANGGQIIIDPNTSTQTVNYIEDGVQKTETVTRNRALLYSSNFWKSYDPNTGLPSNYGNSNVNTPTGVRVDINHSPVQTYGMLIDLTTPQIVFGNGRFSVSHEGHLTAKGGGSIGGWKIGNYELYAEDRSITMQSRRLTDPTQEYDADDNPYLPAKIYSNTHSVLTNTGNGFYLSQDGLSIGSQFKITNDGVVRAGRGATVANRDTEAVSPGKYWIIDAKQGKEYIQNNDQVTQVIEYHSHISYNATDFSDTGTNAPNSVYIGTNGITLGKGFSVDNRGHITILRGRIAMGNTFVQRMDNSGNPIFDSNGDPVMELNPRSKFLIDTVTGEFELNISKGNINFGNGRFTVNEQGYMQATSGKIGGFYIGNKYLANPSTLTTFQQADGSNDSYSSVYLGTDGISLGTNFSVSNLGIMKIRKGSIQLGPYTENGQQKWHFSVDNDGHMIANSGLIGGIKIYLGEILGGTRDAQNNLESGFSFQKEGYIQTGPPGNRFYIVGGASTGNNQTGDLLGFNLNGGTIKTGFRIQPGPGTAKFKNLDVSSNIGVGHALTVYDGLSFQEQGNSTFGSKYFQITVDPDPDTGVTKGQFGIVKGGIHGYANTLWGGAFDQTFWISASTGQASFNGTVDVYSKFHAHNNAQLNGTVSFDMGTNIIVGGQNLDNYIINTAGSGFSTTAGGGVQYVYVNGGGDTITYTFDYDDSELREDINGLDGRLFAIEAQDLTARVRALEQSDNTAVFG